jgi:glycosyltransferase involved in cell wall biosynthesis
MRILAVSYDIPCPDQSSGELRFYTLLSLLARGHEVEFYSKDRQGPAVSEAVTNLERLGVTIKHGPFESLLSESNYDVVLFEFYFVAQGLIDLVRVWLPYAKIIVDSVDVHFHRLRSKSRLTGSISDHDEAEKVRDLELAVYGDADLVLTVTDDDTAVLRNEGLTTEIFVIPNIHVMFPLSERLTTDRLELIFIGSYKWSPNVDAMIHFCKDVLPLLRERIPKLRLRVVGSSPNDEIKALAAEDVEIIGYVPETSIYLLSSDISIAPLRYGGGMKGKIGEAMAHGLPVITTSVGAEGFGFSAGSDVLIADSPAEFCEAVLALWNDKERYHRLRTNGWNYIDSRYSVNAVGNLIPLMFERLSKCPSKRISGLRRLMTKGSYYMNKHVLWRFKT